MTNKEIKEELEKVCREMGSWPRLNACLKGHVPEDEVRRRELVLLGQQLLYKIEDAKKDKDKDKEIFNSTLYQLVAEYTR